MKPIIRKTGLVMHIVFSVGWLGAVVAYLPLAITGMTSTEPDTVRAAYSAMEQIGRFAIVPLCLGSLITGLYQSLTTEWGLFRYYWVVAKLVLTVVSTIILLMHMPQVSRMAAMASQMTLPIATPGVLRAQLLVHAAGGLIVLIVLTAISVFKPWGRIQRERE